MKPLIFIISLLSISISINAQKQKGKDWPLIDNANVAIILIDYPDQDTETKSHFPSKEDFEQTFFGPQSVIQRYFDTVSYGKFKLTGEVFGYFTHQEGITEANEYQQNFIKTITTVNIPDFDIDKYDFLFYVSLNDYGWIPGGLAGSWDVEINGVKYENQSGVAQGLHIGKFQRNPSAQFTNIYTDQLESTIFTISGEETFDMATPFTKFERTAIHEMIHAINVGTHANSKTNGGSYEFETEVANNGSYLNSEYGNVFCVMGNSRYATSLNGGYRDLIGWTDEINRVKLDDYGHYNVTLFPINDQNGHRILEIRIPYIYSGAAWAGHKNQGYFLEVRKADHWDSSLSHQDIVENTKGILIQKTDGYTTWLLDASPSPNFSYNWGNFPDYTDIALKPGMSYDDGTHVKFSNVTANSDGSFSLDVDVYETTLSISTPERENQKPIIYPNPSSSSIYINGVDKQGEITLKIFNIIGALCLTEKHFDSKKPINLEKLSPGNYIIQLTTNKGVEHATFTKK